MPINKDGHGPADPEETIWIQHEVWSSNNLAIGSFASKSIAEAVAAALNYVNSLPGGMKHY
jgi:hypothetical protein